MLTGCTEKGAFPLDHYGECKVAMEAYMRCLKQHEMVASCCLDESKVYMQCRMDRYADASQSCRGMLSWYAVVLCCGGMLSCVRVAGIDSHE